MIHYLYKRQKLKMYFFIIITLIICGLEIGTAYIMSLCINFALNQKLDETLKYIILFILYIIIYFSIEFFARKLKYNIIETGRNNLRKDILSVIKRMNNKNFHTKTSGEWLSVFINDIDILDNSYFNIIMDIIPDFFMFLESIVLLFFMSWQITIFILIGTFLQMLIPKIMGKKIAEEKEKLSSEAANFMTTASEHLEGFDVLKSFHLTVQSFNLLNNIGDHLEKTRFKTRFLSSLAMLFSFSLGQVLYIGVYFMGALLAASHIISIGTMIAATQLCVYVAGPMQTLSGNVSEILGARKIMIRLKELLHSEEEKEIKKQKIRPIFDTLEINNLSFSYGNVKIFENANIVFKHGQKYLFESNSGDGKTTLVNLIIRNLFPDKGNIKLNGIDINLIDDESYVKMITSCAQTNFIFNDTLRNNITLFNQRYNDDEIMKVVEKVGLGYVLERNKKGLDVMISQGGKNLSGGEKQRLGLARIELIKSPVIILDESFANLDYETMHELIKIITQDKEKTVIYISHQVSEEIKMYFNSLIQINNYKIVEKKISF